MIIKLADDKRSQKAILQNLINHSGADALTRKRIEQELRNIDAGMRGEEEAAYEMKVHYGENPNWMIIHDLRIEHGGLFAQIDHVIINRLLEIWVCESKHFSEGVAINEHGEFSAFFGSKPYGVPSPIEQNNRHILILKRLFDSGVVSLPTRLGFTLKPNLMSLVLVSKGARISRPKTKIDGLNAIIKNDMLFKTICKSVDDSSPLTIAKFVSAETVEGLARQIASLHKPISMNWHAKFGLPLQPQHVPPTLPVRPIFSPVAALTQPVNPAPTSLATQTSDETKIKQKLVCHACGEAVIYTVAKFCWFNKPKFGGNIYCIDCQKKV
jgi:Nuclease-related domain